MKLFYLTAFLMPLFYIVKKNVTFHAKFQHRNHTEIFNYVSSVSKFQILNPTIINITHWNQTNGTNFFVEYTEYLSQIPAVKNYAKAHYRKHQDDDGSHDLFSHHLTCFFTDIICLSTNSKLRVYKYSRSQVGYQEKIFYSCPWILTKFCLEEITHQRKLIISKLTEIFSTSLSPRNNFEHLLSKRGIKKNRLTN